MSRDGNTFLLYKAVVKHDKNLNHYHKTICHLNRLERRHVNLSPEKVYSQYTSDHTGTGDFLSSPVAHWDETIHS